jgi:hypothetical protein
MKMVLFMHNYIKCIFFANKYTKETNVDKLILEFISNFKYIKAESDTK